MSKRAFMLVLVALLLFAVGQRSPQHTFGQEASKAPVDTWGDWWPRGQFRENDTVSTDAVQKAPHNFEEIQYSSTKTPWGPCSVSLSQDKEDRLRFDLVWSGPGTMASDEERAKHKSPEKGDVQAAIILADKVVRKPTNGEPVIGFWVGGGLGTSGDMMIFFDYLPADFEDYWVRIDMLKERHWFLIPYGLGSNPADSKSLKSTEQGQPQKPASATGNDTVHTWSSVTYDFGQIDDKGTRLSARIANPFDTEISLSIYDEDRRWSLTQPRTTAVYNWPGGYSRFSSWLSISRGDLGSMERHDRFQFWRTPFDTRAWGLLRIAVEETVLERAVPSSLFHYTHGCIQK
ncbi:MAG: hypothetical protein KDB82_01620 [Planctomycetes bacterium]|nr:hypothetical protein [Planctomycetota bacterium]